MNTRDQVISVAIVGGSASGKTWLAEAVTDRIGKDHVIRVSQDDFYQDLAHLDETERKKINFDHPDALDWETLESVFFGLLKGQDVAIPIYDFATHTRISGQTRQTRSGPPLVIWDGLWLLRCPSLREHWTFSYFIHCDSETRLMRRIDRDTKERGRTEDFVRHQFLTNTDPMHQKFVESQSRWATHELHAPVDFDEVEKISNQLIIASGLKNSGMDLDSKLKGHE